MAKNILAIPAAGVAASALLLYKVMEFDII